MPDGNERVVHIAAHDGWVSVKELTETGEPHYEGLECVRIQRHKDKTAYRWYGYFKLPAAYGGGEVSVRFHRNADDDRRGLNRTESLRPSPEGSGDFARLHVLRPDAESINRGIEDSLFINRASAKGWRLRWSICSVTRGSSARSRWHAAGPETTWPAWPRPPFTHRIAASLIHRERLPPVDPRGRRSRPILTVLDLQPVESGEERRFLTGFSASPALVPS